LSAARDGDACHARRAGSGLEHFPLGSRPARSWTGLHCLLLQCLRAVCRSVSAGKATQPRTRVPPVQVADHDWLAAFSGAIGPRLGPLERRSHAVAVCAAPRARPAYVESMVAASATVPTDGEVALPGRHEPGEARNPAAPHASPGEAWLRGGLESRFQTMGSHVAARCARRSTDS